MPIRSYADERSVSLRAGHRWNPVSKATSAYECASAKAVRQASVQELGPTPAWVMSWRQADSTPSGSIAKTDLRSARNWAKVSHAWTIVLGPRPITLEFVNRRSRPIWVIRQKGDGSSRLFGKPLACRHVVKVPLSG
jgi:hypothetical protein